MYYSGVSGRGIGKLKGFSKANELYHFIEYKPTHETSENVYVMTLISKNPRQIVGFDVAKDKSPNRLQTIFDYAPEAENMPPMDI